MIDNPTGYLLPIILFDIEDNIHRKHLGIFSTENAKDIDGLAL